MQISAYSYDLIRKDFAFEYGGRVNAKGKDGGYEFRCWSCLADGEFHFSKLNLGRARGY